jgi:mannose/cellobiose epimerase-like protein (N-acyl-D-glucosamine 2-epimerase family)
MSHARAKAVSLVALAALLLLPAAAAGAVTSPSPGPATGAQSNAAKAASSFRSMQTYLAVPDGSGLYHEQYPVAAGDNPYSYEWPFSQAHIAIADLANQFGARGAQFDSALKVADAAQEHYWNAEGGSTGLPGYASYPVEAFGSGGDFFYDDNEWVGLLDVQRQLTSNDSAALSRAKQIFDLVVSGWDSDPSHASPGGVFWTQAPWSTDRNTVSTMPGAELGLRLFQITGQRSYLDWSLRMYSWTNQNLQRPDGLYNDHVDLQGTVESTIWSYNQGVPVGVNVLLYEVTKDRHYLDEAIRIATAATRYYDTQGRLAGQPAYFNSIFFKNLLLLESVTGGSTYRTAAQHFADQVWTNNRDARTGLFIFGNGHTQLLEQAAMVQVYAVLGWSPSQWRDLY